MAGGKGKGRIPTGDWETLYRKHFPALRRYFASRGFDSADAEDLTHEVFRQLGQSKAPEDPSTYIYAIAKNILSRHRRRRIAEHAALREYCRCATTQNDHLASHTLDTDPLQENPTAEIERILETVVPRLPAKYAELMTLRFIEGLSVKQTAQRTNCSENAVRKRVRKLTAILRQFERE